MNHQQPTNINNSLPHTGRRVHCCKDTGLVYVSSEKGIFIFQGGKMIYTIPSGPVMSFSPSGKYIATDGGVYRAQEPFSLLAPLPLIMDDAAFGCNDSEIIVLSVGCLNGYKSLRLNENPVWTMQYSIHLGESARRIVFNEDKWAILNDTGRLTIVFDNIGYDSQETVPILDQIWPRECWTGDVRLYSKDGYIVIASGQTLWRRGWSDIHNIEDQIFHDSVAVNSVLHDLIVYRDSCRVGDNIYRISRCGKFLIQIIHTPIVSRVEKPVNVAFFLPRRIKPAKPREEPTAIISKTGCEHPASGVMTRSQYKAFIALRSVRH